MTLEDFTLDVHNVGVKSSDQKPYRFQISYGNIDTFNFFPGYFLGEFQ